MITVAYHYDDKKHTVKASSDEYKDMAYNQRMFIQFFPKYPSFAINTNIMVPTMINSVPQSGRIIYIPSKVSFSRTAK